MLSHWLWLFIAGWSVFLALPIAAPVLAMTGHSRSSGLIYSAYRLFCHQLPHRSLWLGGEKIVYDWHTVHAAVGADLTNEYALLFSPVRDAGIGYQTALCQRDLAIYTGLLLTAVVFGLVRQRFDLRPLPWKAYALAVLPAAIDGTTQLVGWRSSTVELRLATGALFGIATGLLVLPHLEAGVREVLAPPARRRATTAGSLDYGAGPSTQVGAADRR